MKHNDLPERWKKKNVEYLRKNGETEREKLSAYDFFPNQILEIKFEDESYAEFRYPLLINAPEFNEVGVFTEHCGYHIFNLGGTYINKKSTLDE
jgi:hypothetical protein